MLSYDQPAQSWPHTVCFGRWMHGGGGIRNAYIIFGHQAGENKLDTWPYSERYY